MRNTKQECAEDLLAIRSARKANRGKPVHTIEEARARLGLVKKKSSRRKSATKRTPR